MHRPQKVYTIKEAKIKAAHFCAYQERSQKEVRHKLYELGLYAEEVEEALADLIADNFVNEERFAKAYAGGKFRIKKWGRQKIAHGMKQHDLSPHCIRLGMSEIDEQDYLATLESLVIQKDAATKAVTPLQKRKAKIAQWLMGKGFEAELVWRVVNQCVVCTDET